LPGIETRFRDRTLLILITIPIEATFNLLTYHISRYIYNSVETCLEHFLPLQLNTPHLCENAIFVKKFVLVICYFQRSQFFGLRFFICLINQNYVLS
jgi:hypothetical protein